MASSAGGDAATERAPMVPLWQLQDRYIVAQTRQGILIVDQHAAHERILYEQALRWLDGEQATSQQLLFPVIVQLAPGESETLETMLDEFPAWVFMSNRSEAMR